MIDQGAHNMGVQRLAALSEEFDRVLKRGDLSPLRFGVSDIRIETIMVPMRDGTKLATDLYLPRSLPAPTVAMRTPYDRASDGNVNVFLSLARRGYAVAAQDCRGTGGSEPDHWDYYMYEAEDGCDFTDWLSRQAWCDGFIASLGGSYVGQVQWCMALHPAMTTFVPMVSGLGVAWNTVHLHMFQNAYAKTVGKGADKIAIPFYEMERLMVDETMATGYFNEPLHKPIAASILAQYPELAQINEPQEAQKWLWRHYCGLSGAERADFVKRALGVDTVTSVAVESLPSIFGHKISHDAHTIPHEDPTKLASLIHAPPLLLTGWYDWCLNDALATWTLMRNHGLDHVKSATRMVIGPHAHNMPGYHEGSDTHPELIRPPGAANFLGLIMRWYESVRDGTVDAWPRVLYYLMGTNEWRYAADWPLPEAHPTPLYLSEGGVLTREKPTQSASSSSYVYDPQDPTPTVGGSIVSYVYPPGSVDVAASQQRDDVLVYTTDVLEHDLTVVGPLQMILYASSSAIDTDFAVRLSDVFPDGRALQLQKNVLRARYRNAEGPADYLEPGRIYRFEIDLWATANCFKAGHRLRIDVSSADFPKFDRNTNLGGNPGAPIPAHQTIYHDAEHPSHLVVSVLWEG